jgi:hypothetical protein
MDDIMNINSSLSFTQGTTLGLPQEGLGFRRRDRKKEGVLWNARHDNSLPSRRRWRLPEMQARERHSFSAEASSSPELHKKQGLFRET